MDWIYTSTNREPKIGEDVLCDFGVGTHFVVLTYNGNDCYEDLASANTFHSNQFNRWSHIGKHWNQQF